MAAERSKRDVNRNTVILGVTNDSALDPTMVRMDASTLRVLVNSTITGGVTADNLGTAVKYGQKAYTSGAAVSLATTQTIKNGLIIQALSTNTVSVYVGDSSVTTSTGFELQAGQATSIAITDPSTVYIIASAAASVCWISST